MSVIRVNQITNRTNSGGPIISGLTTVGVVTSGVSIGVTNLYVEQVNFGQTGILTGAVSVGTTDLYVSGTIFGNVTGNVTGDVTGNADTATAADTVVLGSETTDTQCFVGFTVDQTGTTDIRTNANLTFDSAAGTLVATAFSGTQLNVSQVNASGVVTASTFSGSGASLTSIPNGALDNSTISGISLGGTLGTLTMAVSGTGLSGSDTYDGSAGTTFTVTSNATNANTASTIVARDASGNFSAGTITASLSGNATTATTATNANNINLADESSDTTCFPVFATGATGNLAPKTDADRLTYNASSGLLVASTHQATSIIADSTLRVGSATTSSSLYVVGNSASGVVGLTSQTSSFALDFSLGNNFSFVIGANITLNNPTGITTGQSGVIHITQDDTGSRTLAFQSYWNFANGSAPTITAGAGTTSVLTYYVHDYNQIITAPLLALGPQA